MAPLNLDAPNLQPFHYFDQTTDPPQWHRASSSSTINTIHGASQTDTLRLITWNIDFRVPAAKERMTAALQHLANLLSDLNTSPPTIIFFQEMVASDLDLIQNAAWIQHRFYITDCTPRDWRSRYGTTTLIDRRLDVQRVFRLPYSNSRMGRDGLFVDLGIIPSNVSRNENRDQNKVTIRLCNTHLESLVSNPPRRPVQLKLASTYMHGNTSNTNQVTPSLPVPHAALLAGDLNAFAPEDATAPGECGLLDAFLVLGGKEGSDEGFTWGKQSPAYCEKFGCSRIDKVLFCGGLEAVRLDRIGEGVKVWVEYSHDEDEDEEGKVRRARRCGLRIILGWMLSLGFCLPS